MYKLRELARGDIATVNKWREARELVECLGGPYRFIGIEIDDAWFDSYLASRANTVRCAVVDSEAENSIVGLVTLAHIDWVNRSCELHIMIGPEAQGRGAGKYAVNEILRHAFADLGLHRVELGVLATNHRARELYEAIGFKHEGVLREAVFKNGDYVNLLAMSLLRSEWELAVKPIELIGNE